MPSAGSGLISKIVLASSSAASAHSCCSSFRRTNKPSMVLRQKRLRRMMDDAESTFPTPSVSGALDTTDGSRCSR